MKRILFLFLFLALCGSYAHGQNTIVTATVTDPRGFPYQAGFGQSSIQCTGNAQPYLNGSPLTRSIPIPALDGNGHFQASLWDTTGLTDANGAPLVCQWRISISDHCNVATFSVLVTGVTGPGPVDLSAQINAAAVNLSPACTPPGVVQTVTLGNLPPLFTVTVSGLPVNPSFAFHLSNAAAGTVFGNPTGSPAPPVFASLGSFGGLVSSVTSVANSVDVSPTTGNVVLSYDAASLFPGTVTVANNITSTAGDLLAPGGRLIVQGNIITTLGSATIAATQSYAMSGRSRISSDADGNLSLTSNNFGSFNRLNFGPSASNLWPALQVNVVGPGLDVVLGDNSGFAALRALNLTGTSLTSGNCVQAGVGGLLGTTSGPCASGFTKSATATSGGCTTQGTSYANCDVTMTWSNSGFADTSYMPACSVKSTNLQASGGDGSSGDAPSIPIRSFTTTQITVALQTLRGAALSAANITIYCIGIHP